MVNAPIFIKPIGFLAPLLDPDGVGEATQPASGWGGPLRGDLDERYSGLGRSTMNRQVGLGP